jgi:hypothetical protein
MRRPLPPPPPPQTSSLPPSAEQDVGKEGRKPDERPLPPPLSSPQRSVEQDLQRLFLDSFSSSATLSEAEWKSQVDERRARVADLNSRAEQVLGVSEAPGLGLPSTNAGLLNLLTEAAVLPNPHLAHIQQGRTEAPASVPSAAPHMGFLSNPFVHAWLKNNPTALADAAKASHHPAMEALAREGEQRWLEIPWISDAQDAKQLSQELEKPIFVEIVVGRLADASESSLC